MNTASEAADIPARGKKWQPVALALCLPGAVLLKMGLLFLILGMLPTLAALALVRPPRIYIISTIAAFNFAGLFPDLLAVVLQQGRLSAVTDKLSDPSVWCSMYGAALLGIAAVWLSPSIAMLILEGVYRSRMRQMENMRKKLEEEWGTEIMGRKE